MISLTRMKFSRAQTIIMHALLLSLVSKSAAKYPFQDPTLPWDERVTDLLGRLTVEEIVNQTIALSGQATPPISRLGIKPYVWITECLRGQAYTNATAFPQALGLAATFSQDLIFHIAEAISYEVRAHFNANEQAGVYKTSMGLSCFSPVINIMRHPLWGRNQETYGEDPFLSGSLATMFVHGLQGSHPRYVRANAGCKHFDVHGGPENIPVSRFNFSSNVTDRDWYTTFLPQFKACVMAGTYSLMCSYNSINEVPSCVNKKLLTDIARKSWGFSGYVVSDAGAISNIMTQYKYTNNSVDTAVAAIKAGCNMELATGVFLSQLDAIKQGKLSEAEVRENARPIFNTRMRLGEFDPPEMNPYTKISMSVVQSPAHRQLALDAAIKSFVLLKNDNKLLPLTTKVSTLAIIGPMADNAEQLFGDYSSNVNPTFTKTPLEGLAGLGDKVVYTSGCHDPACKQYQPAPVKTAVQSASLIIVCLGTGQAVEAEGHDRPNMDLPGHQLQLLQDAANFNPSAPILLLLFNAGPLVINWAVDTDRVSSILECFFPAQATGDALFAVLTNSNGTSSPAGRLPFTWPESLAQVPSITNYTMKGRTYRYLLDDPLYPFGYGLSYSSFHYANLTILGKQPFKLKPGDNVTVTVDVVNQGPYNADEVIQLYIEWTDVWVPVPKRQLADFKRCHLLVGKNVTVTLTIPVHVLAVWMDTDLGFVVRPGQVNVWAGGQQPKQMRSVGSNWLKGSFIIAKSLKLHKV